MVHLLSMIKQFWYIIIYWSPQIILGLTLSVFLICGFWKRHNFTHLSFLVSEECHCSKIPMCFTYSYLYHSHQTPDNYLSKNLCDNWTGLIFSDGIILWIIKCMSFQIVFFTQQYIKKTLSFCGWVIFLCVVYHSLFIHSPIEGQLSCFQIWAMMNKTVWIFVWV
jgi:hypothetical protein